MGETEIQGEKKKYSNKYFREGEGINLYTYVNMKNRNFLKLMEGDINKRILMIGK